MFRNYLAAALRNLVRNRLYTAINIIGLAVGFAAALLIALFVRDEFSYDTWIPGHERTYLVSEDITLPGRAPFHFDRSFVELAPLIQQDIPTVTDIARFINLSGTLRHGDVESIEEIYWADPNIFAVLPLPVIAGDPTAALQRPDGVVITRAIARKYFGRDAPLGEILELDRKNTLVVSAVIDDLPSNTHLDTKIFASGLAAFSRIRALEADIQKNGRFQPTVYTYLRLPTNAAAGDTERDLASLIDRHMSDALKSGAAQGIKDAFTLVAIADLHLAAGRTASMKGGRGNLATIQTVSAVGLLIVLLAVINFVNLTTAQAARRSVEVGIRKVAGAERLQLVVQFIGEALVVVSLASLCAIAIVLRVLPAFNAFLERTIEIATWVDLRLAAGMIAVAGLTGLLTGAYPAFVLSSFRPAAVLKGIAAIQGSSAIRQVLVTFQFAALVGLSVAAGIMYQQIRFGMYDNMRLETDQTLFIQTSCSDTFKTQVRNLPGVRAAACASGTALNFATALGPVLLPDGTQAMKAAVYVDPAFFDLFGFQPIAGRFSSDTAEGAPTDWPPTIVINETAVRRFGFSSPQAAIGQSILFGIDPKNPVSEIIGVAPDFSLRAMDRIEPTTFIASPGRFQYLVVKLAGQDIPETLNAIDRAWKQVGEPRPFNSKFMDSYVQDLFRNLMHQAQILGLFAAVAIFIACLGLFGLSAFTAERRTKEIGIRKAMGASRADILKLLLWQFAKPVLWANVIAWPLGYYVMNRWLSGFAYHVDLELWIFLAASGAALLIALLTVASHALAISRAKPVGALRYE